MVMLFPLTSFSQIALQPIEQLDHLQKNQNRFVMIFIHTDWCKYCQAMKNITFKDKEIVELLNQNFWFIDFNAEEKKSITFNGQTFKFRPTGINTGIHEFTEQFAKLNDEVTYPSIYILNPNYDSIENKILTQESKPKEKPQNRPKRGINRGNFATSWK